MLMEIDKTKKNSMTLELLQRRKEGIDKLSNRTFDR